MILTNSELKTIQKIEVEMLREVIKVCKKLNISYYAIGGTLIGAVRHKGFIPWDDDIDIVMLRKDYEVFIKEGQKYLPPHLFIQNAHTNKNYPYNFTKLVNLNTTFIQNPLKNFKIHHGIFIDIFPLDFIPNNLIVRKFFYYINRFLYLLIASSFDLKISNPIKKILIFIIKLFTKKIYRYIVCIREKTIKLYKTGNLVANYSGAWVKKEIGDFNWFGEGILLTFEDIKVNCPTHYDKWLTKVYGNYKLLPPVDKRKPHPDLYICDFNKSYLEYINKEK